MRAFAERDLSWRERLAATALAVLGVALALSTTTRVFSDSYDQRWVVLSPVLGGVVAIGVGGVLTRRNPLVVLLCLELMLNAANLSLIGFSRMWNNADGQIFAIIVMVVAACEVTVGLGIVVAMHRRRLPVDVDELRELQG